MFEFLTHLVDGSVVSYLAIVGIVAADSMVPLVPGETAVMTGGILAPSGVLVKKSSKVTVYSIASRCPETLVPYACRPALGHRLIIKIDNAAKQFLGQYFKWLL